MFTYSVGVKIKELELGPAHLHHLGQTLKRHKRRGGLGGPRSTAGRALAETAGSGFPNDMSVLAWAGITL